MERILYLKSLPNLGDAPIDHLVSLAEYLEERTYRRGQVLIAADGPVEAIHFVVSGSVRGSYRGKTIVITEPPSGVGLLGALSRVTGEYEAVAEMDTRTLSIHADAFFGIIEDNFGMMLAGLKQMSRDLLDARERLPDLGLETGDDPNPPYPETDMDLVERLVWACRPDSVYENSNVDAVMQICRAQTEVRWPAGHRIYSQGDPSDFGFSIRWGRIRAWGNSGEREFTAGAGFGMGFLDGMAGIPRQVNVEAETEVVAIVGPIASTIDVLEDNADLAFDLTAGLATFLLELLSKVGPA